MPFSESSMGVVTEFWTAPAVAPVLTSADARDVHSYARPLEARSPRA